mgnify:CR=1 FL=1
MENFNRVVGQNLRLMYMGEVMVILGLLCSFVVRWFPIIGLILIPAVLLEECPKRELHNNQRAKNPAGLRSAALQNRKIQF